MLTDGQEILEGRFQIVKKLGSGAFGEIYKGKFGQLDDWEDSHPSSLIGKCASPIFAKTASSKNSPILRRKGFAAGPTGYS